MLKCGMGDNCHPICNHCAHMQRDSEVLAEACGDIAKDRRWTGKGTCLKHGARRDLDDHCDDFYCNARLEADTLDAVKAEAVGRDKRNEETVQRMMDDYRARDPELAETERQLADTEDRALPDPGDGPPCIVIPQWTLGTLSAEQTCPPSITVNG